MPAQARRKIYLADYPNIRRANLDGSGVENLLFLVTTGLLYPHGLAVGGLAHGFEHAKVVCQNITTGEHVKTGSDPSEISTAPVLR